MISAATHYKDVSRLGGNRKWGRPLPHLGLLTAAFRFFHWQLSIALIFAQMLSSSEAAFNLTPKWFLYSRHLLSASFLCFANKVSLSYDIFLVMYLQGLWHCRLIDRNVEPFSQDEIFLYVHSRSGEGCVWTSGTVGVSFLDTFLFLFFSSVVPHFL